ncbi:MAG TPA: DUF3617 domain-containing protein [Zeimonas sp.]|nr:DUF3617 domain-containing protein [Zeimonas sp.]
MKRHSGIATVVVALALGLGFTDAWSQKLPQREPGLWEIKVDMKGALAQMQEQMRAAMAAMSPEERKQMEQAMGAQPLALSGEPQLECLTPEEAARDPFESDEPDEECTHKITPVSRSEAKFTFTCKGPDGTSTGSGRIWNMTSKRYETEMTITTETPDGPQEMQLAHSGRWLGADCKGTKPIR